MSRVYRDLLIIIISTIFITILIWIPHYLRLSQFYGLDFSKGFATIYTNYDGLEYITVAKTFYDPAKISQIPYHLPSVYYPSHFPGFPALIALFAPLLGYLKSMLFVSLLFTILSDIAFYFFLKNNLLTKQPLWLSLVFLILPARWLIVHSVGSPEPIFIFFTILAIYFFQKFISNHQSTNLWSCSIFGSLALLVRPPGILLFIALAAFLTYTEVKKQGLLRGLLKQFKYFPLLLIPLTLLGIFGLFYLMQGNFLAYFHTGDNIHLVFPPFQVFNKSQFWVGDIWLEDIVYIFILGTLAGFKLLGTQIPVSGFFVLTYLLASSFVVHRDISRYTLPVFPFVLIAFEKVLVSKEFKIVLVILLLGIYLYAQNFILNNTYPIYNLAPFN